MLGGQDQWLVYVVPGVSGSLREMGFFILFELSKSIWNKFELNELAYPVICKSEKRNLSLTSCFGNLVLPRPVILRLF